MNKFLFLGIIILSLNGCAGHQDQDGVLTSVLYFVSVILCTLVLGPSVWLMGKATDTKNKNVSIVLWVISIGSAIFIMFNLGNIFAFIGRLLGFGN